MGNTSHPSLQQQTFSLFLLEIGAKLFLLLLFRNVGVFATQTKLFSPLIAPRTLLKESLNIKARTFLFLFFFQINSITHASKSIPFSPLIGSFFDSMGRENVRTPANAQKTHYCWRQKAILLSK